MWRIATAFVLLFSGCAFYAPRNSDIGGQYLGAQYILDPLGEGSGYDTDPLIRFDAFDCTTFVETVLANGDLEKLTQIRYANGNIDWRARNHFIETDWLGNNANMLENISAQYGPVSVRNVHIDKRAWAHVAHDMDINAKSVDTTLEYIAYDDLPELKNTEPLIILFVIGPRDTNNKIATDIAVVHMGFVLPGGKILRHASTGRGVVDDDFSQYVAKRKKMKNNIGIALVRIK